jgi:cytochrome c553
MRKFQRSLPGLIAAAAVLALPAPAANVDAGKAKVAEVCAACHGPDGVSVSDTIPNLAGQRARYIEDQLRALKSGARKNGIMNAVAAQLSGDDIANIAAYFGTLPGAAVGARSEFMPTIARTQARYPADKKDFTKYNAANFPELKQVRVYLANTVALRAAKTGTRLPAGSVILTENYTVKLDDRLDLAKGADGVYIPNQLVSQTVMERGDGWGKAIPAMLRNEDWNYAVFQASGAPRPGINLAECLACHKAQDEVNFLFTMKELRDAALKLP